MQKSEIDKAKLTIRDSRNGVFSEPPSSALSVITSFRITSDQAVVPCLRDLMQSHARKTRLAAFAVQFVSLLV